MAIVLTGYLLTGQLNATVTIIGYRTMADSVTTNQIFSALRPYETHCFFRLNIALHHFTVDSNSNVVRFELKSRII